MLKTPQITLFFLASFIAVLWMAALNYNEFSSYEMLVYSGYVAGIFAVQLVIILLLLSLGKLAPRCVFLSKLVATLFTTFNIYTLIVIHNGRFSNLEGIWFILFLLFMASCLSLMFFVRNKKFLKFVHTFSLIMIVSVSSQFLVGYTFSVDSVFTQLPNHFRFVDFKERPNIYIVSFDALTPETVAKKIVGIGRVPYIEVIEQAGGRFIKNVFADRIPTKRSLNSFLAMDIAYYESVDRQGNFVRDQVPNPSYEILRHNGYKIQFIYASGYFGDDKGRLDYYGIAAVNGLCKHVEKSWSFMGYCLNRIQNKISDFIKTENAAYPEFLFERIKQTAQSGEPWFTLTHIYAPGHAKLSFNARKESDRESFRKSFSNNSRKAAEYLKELFTIMRKYDPEAVLIILGDHGPITSVGLLDDYDGLKAYALDYGPGSLPADSPMTFEQLVQDRHAVVTAVFPPDFCPDGFTHNPYSKSRVMRDIMKCLSGEDPLPAGYQTDDSHWAPYLYE